MSFTEEGKQHSPTSACGCPCIHAWGGSRPSLVFSWTQGYFQTLLFPVFAPSVRIASRRLRHSGSPERDSSPTGTFPTERTGSRQECRAWVKRSRSIITLLFRQVLVEDGYFVRVPGGTSVPMMCRSVKLKRGQLRIEVETRHKPLTL